MFLATDLRLAAGGVAATEVRVPLLLRHPGAGEEIGVLFSHLQGAAEHREVGIRARAGRPRKIHAGPRDLPV